MHYAMAPTSPRAWAGAGDEHPLSGVSEKPPEDVRRSCPKCPNRAWQPLGVEESQ